MKQNRNREESLSILKDYCSRVELFGIYNHTLFESLKNAYPLEFYYYTQYTRRYIQSRKCALDKVKLDISNNIELILKLHLEQNDIDQLNEVVKKIEQIYVNKLKQSKN